MVHGVTSDRFCGNGLRECVWDRRRNYEIGITFRIPVRFCDGSRVKHPDGNCLWMMSLCVAVCISVSWTRDFRRANGSKGLISS